MAQGILTKLTLDELNLVISLAVARESYENIAARIGTSTIMARWIVDFIDTNGKEKAKTCLVDGIYEKYEPSMMLGIAALYYEQQIPCYRLELAFAMQRNFLSRFLRKVSGNRALLQQVGATIPVTAPQEKHYLQELQQTSSIEPQHTVTKIIKEEAYATDNTTSKSTSNVKSNTTSKAQSDIASKSLENEDKRKLQDQERTPKELLAQKRHAKINTILGAKPLMLSASQFTPVFIGPIPTIDPSSEGFEALPEKLKQISRSNFEFMEQVRVRAKSLLEQYDDDVLLKFKKDAIRYLLLQVLQNEFPKNKFTLIHQAIRLHIKTKIYYDLHPISADKFESDLKDTGGCFF